MTWFGRSHNPKVAGSNPAPATAEPASRQAGFALSGAGATVATDEKQASQGRTDAYRVTVPVKVSRPSPILDSNTALIRPPPLSPSKRPRPFTTFQSLLCFRPGCVGLKVIVRVPRGQRKVFTTNLSGGFPGPSTNLPPAQKAESPMVDPERTSPERLASRVEGSQVRLDQDWLAALFGGRSGLSCAGSCSALVSVIVPAGGDAQCGDNQCQCEPMSCSF